MTFKAGRKEHTFTVTINDDVNLEFDEYFFLDLAIPAAAAEYGVTKASPDTATVNIEDDGETCYKLCTAFASCAGNVHPVLLYMDLLTLSGVDIVDIIG